MATVAEPAEQLLYRPEEAAKALRIGRSMVYEEIRLGRLQTVRIGRRRLVPPEYIARYVELLKSEAEATV
ncbi:helix-turn-helix domain-containing protein [Streptomyces griseorubiginosus]|uniref:helix-turn-helix domain-containing protein n=1 Tax=Streptomyces griseorubiginosus TaxID=67304 RepID=UPI0036482B5E